MRVIRRTLLPTGRAETPEETEAAADAEGEELPAGVEPVGSA